MLLDPTRYQYGWGTGFGNWGASTELPQYTMAPDVTVRALNRLIAQYQNDPGMTGLVKALTGPMQSLFDACATVLNHRQLDTAFGFMLDQIGDFLRVLRLDQYDNSYRIRLAAQAIVSSVTGGTPEEVRSVLDFLMQGLQGVRLIESPPATTILQTFELQQGDGDFFAIVEQGAAPIGTRIIIRWQLPASFVTFGFESDNTGGPWLEWGADPVTAGYWAEAYDGRI